MKWAAIVATLAATATAEPAPVNRWPTPEADAPPILSRLVGHRAAWRDGALVIDAIADVGAPWIGRVTRRPDGLWLEGDGFAWPLRGPLARPRLAGPGYLVWVIGAVTARGLEARRLGVLAPPR